MSKTLLYKLFRLGKMPDELKQDMEYFEEGIKVTLTWRGYRAAWKYFALRRQWFSGALGYSKSGVVGILRKQKYIDVPFDHELYQKLSITLKDAYISIAFKSEDFQPNTSGQIEVRFYVENFDRFQKLFQA